MKVAIVAQPSDYRKMTMDYLLAAGMDIQLQALHFGEFAEQIEQHEALNLLLVELREDNYRHLFKYKRLLPNAFLVAYTGLCHNDLLENAICEGADAIILTRDGVDALRRAIDSVCVGQAYIAPQATRLLFEHLRRARGERLQQASRVADEFLSEYPLKPKEMQVAQGLIEGKTYDDIAQVYQMSVNTVRYYVKTLYRKMNIHKRSELLHLVYGITS